MPMAGGKAQTAVFGGLEHGVFGVIYHQPTKLFDS